MLDKTISIIIPYYDESPKDMFLLLSSINNQVGIDFSKIECVLVNDGNNNKLPDKFLSLFGNVDFKCILMDDNKGPGVARQTGIDNAAGEYVMFCDADDILHSVSVLGMFLNEINNNHPDIITSSWLEELYDGEKYVYINHEDESTWMHGKAFRRLFLQSKNIRFHEDLRIHEDSYFLALAMTATQNQRKLLFTSYIWKYVTNSITRRENGVYTYDSIPEFIRAIKLSFDVLEKTNPEIMTFKTIQFIMYCYFSFHQWNWKAPENEKYLKQAENSFKEMILPYFHYYTNAGAEFVDELYNGQRAKSFEGHMETETLEQWLERLNLKI